MCVQVYVVVEVEEMTATHQTFRFKVRIHLGGEVGMGAAARGEAWPRSPAPDARNVAWGMQNTRFATVFMHNFYACITYMYVAGVRLGHRHLGRGPEEALQPLQPGAARRALEEQKEEKMYRRRNRRKI